MGVGIDIVKVERIELNDRFLKRVLSDEEIKILATKPNKKEFVAGRFAAKEAFLKANRKGLFDMSMNEIKVIYDTSGAPIISYQGQIYNNVSISHEREFAIAIVII